MQIKINCFFFQTMKKTIQVWENLAKIGIEASLAYGQMPLPERLQKLEHFRNERKILVSTNLLARAIDVKECRIVVNFDLPLNESRTEPNARTYQFRATRAGRFGSKAAVISLIETYDMFTQYKAMASYFNFSVNKIKIKI